MDPMAPSMKTTPSVEAVALRPEAINRTVAVAVARVTSPQWGDSCMRTSSRSGVARAVAFQLRRACERGAHECCDLGGGATRLVGARMLLGLPDGTREEVVEVAALVR